MPRYKYIVMRSTKPHLPEEEKGFVVSDVELSYSEARDLLIEEGIPEANRLRPSGNDSGSPYMQVEQIETEEESASRREIEEGKLIEALDEEFSDGKVSSFFLENRYRNSFYMSISDQLISGKSLSDAQKKCVKDDFTNEN